MIQKGFMRDTAHNKIGQLIKILNHLKYIIYHYLPLCKHPIAHQLESELLPVEAKCLF